MLGWNFIEGYDVSTTEHFYLIISCNSKNKIIFPVAFPKSKRNVEVDLNVRKYAVKFLITSRIFIQHMGFPFENLVIEWRLPHLEWLKYTKQCQIFKVNFYTGLCLEWSTYIPL